MVRAVFRPFAVAALTRLGDGATGFLGAAARVCNGQCEVRRALKKFKRECTPKRWAAAEGGGTVENERHARPASHRDEPVQVLDGPPGHSQHESHSTAAYNSTPGRWCRPRRSRCVYRPTTYTQQRYGRREYGVHVVVRARNAAAPTAVRRPRSRRLRGNRLLWPAWRWRCRRRPWPARRTVPRPVRTVYATELSRCFTSLFVRRFRRTASVGYIHIYNI